MIRLFLNLLGISALAYGCMYFLWVSSYHLLFDGKYISAIFSPRYAILGILGAHVFVGLSISVTYTYISRWHQTKTFEKHSKFSILDKKIMLIFSLIGLGTYFINNYYIERYDLVRCESDLTLDRDDFYFSRYVSSIEECPIKLEANKKK